MKPLETPVSLLDNILRPACSPQFCMYFEPSGVTASEHLFDSSPTLCWGEKTSASQHWEDGLNRPKSKGAVMFGSVENSYMNQTRAAGERSSGSHYSGSIIQHHPAFPYQAKLPDAHLARCAPVQDPFKTDKFSFVSSSSTKRNHQQHSHLNQFIPPLHYPLLRSHYTDMMNYPPSHMLEKDPAPSLEHWSFPPMRLY